MTNKRHNDPDDPIIIQRAKALRYLLRNKSVRIFPDELIAGRSLKNLLKHSLKRCNLYGRPIWPSVWRVSTRYLRELPGKPMNPVEGTLVYLVLEEISCSIWQPLFVVVSRRERQIILTILKSYKSYAALTGIGIYFTYGIVPVSMNYVSNISYVALFRQLSIPLGAIFGMALLKEPRYLPKIVGTAAIFFGLVLAGVK